MNCSELIHKIQRMEPQADQDHVARLSLLMYNFVDDISKLDDDEFFCEMWAELNLRLQAATDQHAAVTDELEKLACSDPKKFSAEQIWILVRAIKVQSQVLRMYTGEPAHELT